jgi:phage shock protein PspC (stress-responsive transcriptional regulator)
MSTTESHPVQAAGSDAAGAIGTAPDRPSDSLPVATPPSAPETPADRPRATRVAEGSLLGGVCTGLARHLGWPVMVIRIGFVALTMFQFIGVIAYGALWLLLPPESTTSRPA